MMFWANLTPLSLKVGVDAAASALMGAPQGSLVLFPLLHLIFSYYAEGSVASCMGDHVIRYFPPPGAYADLDELLGCEFGFLHGPWIAQV